MDARTAESPVTKDRDNWLQRERASGRFYDRLAWAIGAFLLVMAHPDREAQRQDVEDVLASLGLGEEGGPPRIEAWNKVDLLAEEERQRLFEEAKRREDVVPISAISGEGLDALRECMSTLQMPFTSSSNSRSSAASPGGGRTPSKFL